MVQVKGQITQKDFVNFNFRYLFSRPIAKIFIGIAVFVFASSLLNAIMLNTADYEAGSLFDQLMPILVIFSILAFSCWSVYHQSKRSYSTTNSVHEPITFTFSDTGLHLKGNSFESDLDWGAIYKVEETKSWFLFYQSSAAAIIVPKTAFENQEQVRELRALIVSQQQLKHKLKKD